MGVGSESTASPKTTRKIGSGEQAERFNNVKPRKGKRPRRGQTTKNRVKKGGGRRTIFRSKRRKEGGNIGEKIVVPSHEKKKTTHYLLAVKGESLSRNGLRVLDNLQRKNSGGFK